jgi:uncharacterized protein YaiI (UPF0178 family)
MALIVDGMNVIGAVPDGWWRDRTGAMRRLLGKLAERGTDDIVLVLDGRERDLGDPGPVKVRWAAHADDLIAELAGPGDTVVTSDRELIERVRAKDAEVFPARAFRRELDG